MLDKLKKRLEALEQTLSQTLGNYNALIGRKLELSEMIKHLESGNCSPYLESEIDRNVDESEIKKELEMTEHE
jgi:hypothetical protein